MNDLDPDTIHYRLLKLLSENADLTQRQMAKEMGISLGKLSSPQRCEGGGQFAIPKSPNP